MFFSVWQSIHRTHPSKLFCGLHWNVFQCRIAEWYLFIRDSQSVCFFVYWHQPDICYPVFLASSWDLRYFETLFNKSICLIFSNFEFQCLQITSWIVVDLQDFIISYTMIVNDRFLGRRTSQVCEIFITLKLQILCIMLLEWHFSISCALAQCYRGVTWRLLWWRWLRLLQSSVCSRLRIRSEGPCTVRCVTPLMSFVFPLPATCSGFFVWWSMVYGSSIMLSLSKTALIRPIRSSTLCILHLLHHVLTTMLNGVEYANRSIKSGFLKVTCFCSF